MFTSSTYSLTISSQDNHSKPLFTLYYYLFDQVDDENLDADNLFAYLLLEKHVPLSGTDVKPNHALIVNEP